MSQAAEPIRFDVRYDEATLRAAAWVFVSAGAFGRRGAVGVLASALAAGVVWSVWRRGAWTFWDGFALAGVVVYPALLALAYVLRLRDMRAKVAGMRVEGSRVTLTEDDIEIAADSGSVRLAWRNLVERIERGGVMLLLMSKNQFVTLPLRDTPSSAQDFLRRKIPKLAG
jgi:hypothetical protein